MTALIARRPALLLIVIAFFGFISLGLPDGLLGVAWPSIYKTFGIPLDSLGILLLAATSGYILASFNTGRFIARFGTGRLLALACALMGSGLLGYSLVPAWPLFVGMGFFVGLGAGTIDAGLNTFVAANFSPSLMYWLHACFGLGATIGPAIMNFAISNASWRLGYLLVGVGLFTLAGTFLSTASRWTTPEAGSQAAQNDMMTHRTPARQSLRLAPVRLSILLFFCYAGVELSAAHWAFTLLTQSRGVPQDTASAAVSAFWGLFTIGRLIAGFAARKIGPTAQIRLGMTGAILGAALYWWNPAPVVGIAGLVLIGFSSAPIFPALISNTAARVGVEHATNTIGFQVAAAGVGVAILPGLTGVLARNISLEIIGPCILAAAIAIFALHEMIMGLRTRKAA